MYEHIWIKTGNQWDVRGSLDNRSLVLMHGSEEDFISVQSSHIFSCYVDRRISHTVYDELNYIPTMLLWPYYELLK